MAGILGELLIRIGARFSRVEPRRRAKALVLGLLAELPRKNCWTIAEHAGDRSPACSATGRRTECSTCWNGQIPLTRNEIAHLLATTATRPAHDAAHPIR